METLDSDHNVGEVDTSAPFESVKEAVSRFGGVGFWKPHNIHASQTDNEEEFDATKAEEQAARLANDLVIKERETLNVLKELEATKTIIEDLKLKLQKESVAVNPEVSNPVPIEGNDKNTLDSDLKLPGDSLMCPSSSSPGFILIELKQAKLNLTRTTSDLADIRSTVESFKNMIEKEKLELEKTRQRLSSNCTKVSSFEENVDFEREIQRLTSETEEFKKVREVAKSEVLDAVNRIEQTKMNIKTAEVRLIAARKLKEAAQASVALAQAEIKSMSKSQTLTEHEGVTLSFEEYSCLKRKAREADEAIVKNVNLSMVKVNDSELSKSETLTRVEEAMVEVQNCKKALEDALNRAEAANKEKLKAEEALRKWRSDHGQRRKSTVQNSTKFKNVACRTNNTRLLDVNGAHLESNTPGPGPFLGPTMSIGQILSRKLLLTEEYSGKTETKRKVSLAQMLSKASGNDGTGGSRSAGKRRSGKRKKFGFGRISFLVTKPSKKKKKHSVSSRLSSATD